MQFAAIDYAVVIGFFLLTLSVGLWVSKRSGQNTTEYFLSGRNLPWWLLGMSMVATTFSTDTPNLVTDLVRTHGVSGNWVWWAFLLTGMLTVFIYARLWRRSGVTTDLEFYELRYSGKPAKFLRAFRSVYLGLLFNVIAMAMVTLAAIKIGQVMLDLPPILTVGVAGAVTVVFSSFGGFRGVVYTDAILFFVAMTGAIGAAYVSVNHEQVGGITNLLSHPAVAEKISILPDFNNTDLLVTVFVIPIAVQWWSAWYPGAEPGGGGYVAQRMLAAKDEDQAIVATFFFNILHYALRPWAWILVALSSLVVFPDIASLQSAFPAVTADKLGHDLAYPAMLTFLPTGLLGLVVASLVAAYMSTISTHLNWGASYIVHDFYRKTIDENASETTLVNVGRITTVVLMVLAVLLALSFTNAAQVFRVIIMFGAGSGLIFLLRWFWWRINAWSEITAMTVSGIVSVSLAFTPIGPFLFGPGGTAPSYLEFPFVVLVTTAAWLLVTYITPPEPDEKLIEFYEKIRPGGPGWKKIAEGTAFSTSDDRKKLAPGILASVVGTFLVYSAMFGTGFWLYGRYTLGLVFTGLAVVFGYALARVWKRMRAI
ncbi:MAG: Na+:solute symporter [Acidobacteria bacterium]|nr:MAG: Na+:solute symporter [Acidobacteriota bacterium]REJ98194.1 MAG: Na+:solute symporter [Acidobacteriota bacterium]REK16938.1 MAG: Na+:solute symporter [Acidobacteriota bacterium]REK42848.1 MAG: Na+:solute symporter [Acidobacteriota bacterium]